MFAVRMQQGCLKTTLMMAKDQRWEVTAGGSLGADQCSQYDALLCAEARESSKNPGVREKKINSKTGIVSCKSGHSRWRGVGGRGHCYYSQN